MCFCVLSKSATREGSGGMEGRRDGVMCDRIGKGMFRSGGKRLNDGTGWDGKEKDQARRVRMIMTE